MRGSRRARGCHRGDRSGAVRSTGPGSRWPHRQHRSMPKPGSRSRARSTHVARTRPDWSSRATSIVTNRSESALLAGAGSKASGREPVAASRSSARRHRRAAHGREKGKAAQRASLHPDRQEPERATPVRGNHHRDAGCTKTRCRSQARYQTIDGDFSPKLVSEGGTSMRAEKRVFMWLRLRLLTWTHKRETVWRA